MPSTRRSPELAVLPLAVLGLHLLTWRGYGWFRDELYYVVCARHLDWGYVDHPPLSIALLKGVFAVFGESLFAMRAVAGVAGAGTVLLVGLITRELGGGRFAGAVAMTAAIVAPQALAIDFFYSMNALDVLAWPAVAYAVLLALRRDRTSLWVAAGALMGLGLLNKVSVLWLGGGLAAGLLLTPSRRVMRRAGPWVAMAVALVMFLPHLLWQSAHGWPTLEFMANAGASKMSSRSLRAFAGAVAMDEGPLVAALGLAGVVAAISTALDRRAAVLAWAWIAVFGLLAVNGTSRTSYLTPAWGWTFALGGIWLERLLAARANAWRVAVIAVLVAFGLIAAPMALPILSTDRFVAYAAALGQQPSTEENKDVGRLPQFFADMNGWDAIVDSLAGAWRRLPADRQPHAVIFGTNYGEAAAIDVIGRTRGLPQAAAAHNNYFLWGPPGDDVDAMVVMSQRPTLWAELFEHVEPAGETSCGDCMPYENRRPIYIAWGRKVPWREVWTRLKHFD